MLNLYIYLNNPSTYIVNYKIQVFHMGLFLGVQSLLTSVGAAETEQGDKQGSFWKCSGAGAEFRQSDPQKKNRQVRLLKKLE